MCWSLQMRSVSKVYGSGSRAVHAVVDADLSVAAGEMVAITGPSGSGKSTLLAIAGGLESATSGEVEIGGDDVAAMAPAAQAALRRRRIGFVFQELNLLPTLTAAENVAAPLELDGETCRAARRVAVELLAAVGLADRAAAFPDELSGGERQRVAIARAMSGDRSVVLADEPTGALDTATGVVVMELLHRTRDRGAAVVVVTHDPTVAAGADRRVQMSDGRLLVTADSPSAVGT